MPRKPKYTKEELLDTAVAIVREEGIEALTARNLVGRLGTAPATIFTHFDSMETLEAATFEKVYRLYNNYVEEGLAMNPPFKGFGMRLAKFGIEEPRLFEFLFQPKNAGFTLEKIMEREGHQAILIPIIRKTFGLDEKDSSELYKDLWIYSAGMASICASGAMHPTDEELSAILGRVCRGLVLDKKLHNDSTNVMPSKDGKVDLPIDYLKKG